MDLFEQEPEPEPWGPAARQGTRMQMFAPFHIQLFLPGAKIKETCIEYNIYRYPSPAFNSVPCNPT